MIGKRGSSSVSNAGSVAAILVYVELLLHVVSSSVVCSKEVGGDLVGEIRVCIWGRAVETLIACVALPLVGMSVVRVQLGVGEVASSVGHLDLAMVSE